MKQGQTKPYLCQATDDELYVVKGDSANCDGLTKEWIAAHLAKAFGLNIPNFCLVHIDPDFDRDNKLNYSDNETCFASSYIQGTTEVDINSISQFEQRAIRDLFLFDYWILNDDRNLTIEGGNPNLFVHPNHDTPFVLDHNLAFSSDFNLNTFKNIHLGAKIWRESVDLLVKEEYTPRIEKALSTLDKAIKSLPPEWVANYSLSSIQNEITLPLQRFQHSNFWEDIK